MYVPPTPQGRRTRLPGVDESQTSLLGGYPTGQGMQVGGRFDQGLRRERGSEYLCPDRHRISPCPRGPRSFVNPSATCVSFGTKHSRPRCVRPDVPPDLGPSGPVRTNPPTVPASSTFLPGSDMGPTHPFDPRFLPDRTPSQSGYPRLVEAGTMEPRSLTSTQIFRLTSSRVPHPVRNVVGLGKEVGSQA